MATRKYNRFRGFLIGRLLDRCLVGLPGRGRNWRYEAIAALGNSLDESGALSRVAQHFANPVDRGVEVVVEVDEGVGPESLLQLLAGHDSARALEKDRKDLEGLAAELQLKAVAAQFSAVEVNLEGCKPDEPGKLDSILRAVVSGANSLASTNFFPDTAHASTFRARIGRRKAFSPIDLPPDLLLTSCCPESTRHALRNPTLPRIVAL
jgi:hypothetical protein